MGSRFAGKSVLVAGGTGALGRAVSTAFLEESANVSVTYHRAEALTSGIEGYKADVTMKPVCARSSNRSLDGMAASMF